MWRSMPRMPYPETSALHSHPCAAAYPKRLTNYCEGDVVATQWLLDWLRPHINNHPALFVDGKDKLTTCNRCGGATEPIAKRYVANVMTYAMQKCVRCGGHSRISIEPERISVVRGV